MTVQLRGQKETKTRLFSEHGDIMIKLNIDVPYRSIDEFAIRDNAFSMQDCFFDDSGAILKRFGTSVYFDLTTVDSNYSDKEVYLYWFQERQTIIAVCNGDIFEYSTLSGTYSKIGSSLLQVDVPVSFKKIADSDNSNTTTLFMTNGSDPIYYDGTTCDLAKNNPNYAGSIPTAVTHLAENSQFLFANDTNNPNTVKYAEATKPFKWNPVAGSPYDIPAQATTDNINCIFDNGGLIYVQGKDSIEPLQNTFSGVGVSPTISPFIRVTRGLIETGTVNPYAIGVVAKQVFFLNTRREIVTLNGFQPVTISKPYTKRIQELSSILDVQAHVQESIGGKTFIIFNFRDAGTSIVFDHSYWETTGKYAFYEWGEWDESSQTYKQYPYVSSAYAVNWNYHLVGGRDGKIYRLRDDIYTDNGSNIRSEFISGVYGNPMVETKSSDVICHFRRGDGLTSDKYQKSYVYVMFRRNLNKAWEKYKKIDNGSIGDTKLNNNPIDQGSYYTIQYRVLHTDDAPFVMYGIYENKKDVNV